MADIEYPYLHTVLAAAGWLELGNPASAREELKRIPAHLQRHPDVLDLRCAICALEESWEEGLSCAEDLVRVCPERESGWIQRAYAMRRMKGGGLQQAWNALRPAYERFPGEPVVAYNLACYAAQFGRLDEAWDWLKKAMAASEDARTIRQLALSDADLEPIWSRLKAR